MAAVSEAAKQHERAYQREWDRQNRRHRTAQDPEKHRRLHLKRRYGITVEDFDAMVTAQGGRCAMCGEILQPGRRTHVDHDHATGKVRGVLCIRCNTQLGAYEAIRHLAEPYLRERA